MRRVILGAAALALLAGSASADVFSLNATVTAGTTNLHGLTANPNDRITGALFGSGTDTVMRLLDPSSTQVAIDDDGGDGLQSANRHTASVSGAYNFQVSNFPDFGFAGASATFSYRLVYSTGATGAEAEANNSVGTANPLAYGTGGSAMDADLNPGDLDFFCFSAVAGELVTAQIDDFAGGGLDTVLGIFDAAGSPLSINDDGGDTSGLNSVLEFSIPADGVYYWGVTGFADFGFTGAHSQLGKYRLVTSGGAPVPAPGALAVLGLAGVAAGRRRRR